MYKLYSLILCFVLLVIPIAHASIWVIPQQGGIIGENSIDNPELGETLSDIGIRHDIGYYEMIKANPHVDPIRPLSPRVTINLPAQHILPPGPREGIVINLVEYRLYYYPPNDNIVITMPVGIGRQGWNTPLGLTSIVQKERDPKWRPTANVRAEAAKNGMPIPNEFPGGEGNPLGRHVLRLTWPTYLIHGTNRRDGVGSRVSAGCIRMLPEDIEQLYDKINVGTPVRLINEPIKIDSQNEGLYVEINPLLDQQNEHLEALVKARLQAYSLTKKQIALLANELQFPSGTPIKLTGK